MALSSSSLPESRSRRGQAGMAAGKALESFIRMSLVESDDRLFAPPVRWRWLIDITKCSLVHGCDNKSAFSCLFVSFPTSVMAGQSIQGLIRPYRSELLLVSAVGSFKEAQPCLTRCSGAYSSPRRWR